MNRRGLIGAFAGLIAAPALVRADSIMPVSVWRPVVLRDPLRDPNARAYIANCLWNAFPGAQVSFHTRDLGFSHAVAVHMADGSRHAIQIGGFDHAYEYRHDHAPRIVRAFKSWKSARAAA